MGGVCLGHFGMLRSWRATGGITGFERAQVGERHVHESRLAQLLRRAGDVAGPCRMYACHPCENVLTVNLRKAIGTACA